MLLEHVVHLARYLVENGLIIPVEDNLGDEAADGTSFVGIKAARGNRRAAYAHAARDAARQRIIGDGVLVGRDAERLEQLLGLLAGDAGRREVDEAEVIVGAARNETQTTFDEALAQGGGVLDDGMRVVGEFRTAASPKATALAAMTCMSGPPCQPGNTALLYFS